LSSAFTAAKSLFVASSDCFGAADGRPPPRRSSTTPGASTANHASQRLAKPVPFEASASRGHLGRRSRLRAGLDGIRAARANA